MLCVRSFPSIILARVVQKNRSTYIGPLAAARAHERIVYMESILHSRLVSANERRPDGARLGNALECVVTPKGIKKDRFQFVCRIGFVELCVLFHTFGPVPRGRCAVDKSAVRNQLPDLAQFTVL